MKISQPISAATFVFSLLVLPLRAESNSTPVSPSSAEAHGRAWVTPDATMSRGEVDLQQALRGAREQRDSLSHQYADGHPLMVESSATIKRMEARAEEMATQERQKLLNIDFPGGSLNDLLKLMHDTGGPQFNVIGDQAVLDSALPSFTIRNSTLLTIGAALHNLLGPDGVIFEVVANGATESSAVIFVVKTVGGSKRIGGRQFICRDISEFLEKRATGGTRTTPYTIDELTSVIRSAYQIYAPSADPEELILKYHPETRLLFIVGSPGAASVAQQTLDALPKPSRLF